MTLIIIPLAVILLVGLLFAEKAGYLAGRIVFKQSLSTLFVVTAFWQPWPVRSYMILIITGLVLSWFGDLFLIFKSRSMFLSGLVAFLLGHVGYALAFFTHGSWHLWIIISLAAVLVIGGLVFVWLRPHLGTMRGPVAAYILIISAMVIGACIFFNSGDAHTAARWLVLAGAILFYASDLFVARDQFVQPGFDNRLAGLPLYYAGQFMFAFSVGLI